MIKYSEIINRFTKKSVARKAPKSKELNRVGYGYMKRRLGLLSHEANALIESQRELSSSKK